MAGALLQAVGDQLESFSQIFGFHHQSQPAVSSDNIFFSPTVQHFSPLRNGVSDAFFFSSGLKTYL